MNEEQQIKEKLAKALNEISKAHPKYIINLNVEISTFGKDVLN